MSKSVLEKVTVELVVGADISKPDHGLHFKRQVGWTSDLPLTRRELALLKSISDAVRVYDNWREEEE